jgi:hypothetical protein
MLVDDGVLGSGAEAFGKVRRSRNGCQATPSGA